MAESTLRQRKHASESTSDIPASESPVSKKKSPKELIRDEDNSSPGSVAIDILRVVVFLLLVSCGLSYVSSGGKSMFWSNEARPKYLHAKYWQLKFAKPIFLTPEQLALHNGQDPSLPLYIAINGSIYDVSVSRRIYGPGGSYSGFAGADASRSFVTGCFATDVTPDMRGVEEMFMPVDDPEIDKLYTPELLAELKKHERKWAEQQVETALNHWINFFKKSDKYIHVGYVQREDGWLDKMETPPLCDAAKANRPKRKRPDELN